MPPAAKLIDQKFGLLTVTERAPNKGIHSAWKCTCECGGTTIVMAVNLKTGGTRSCGCVKTGRKPVHGMHGTPVYKAWRAMFDRCDNPNTANYARYGGRGIKVCDRWRKFEPFFADMGQRPSLEHSIDRIDNDGPYTAKNCRWATRIEQARNRSSNVTFTSDGETLTSTEWGERLGLDRHLIARRIAAGHTDPKVVLATHDNRESVFISHGNETLSVAEWGRKLGVDRHTIYARLKRGWTDSARILAKKRFHKSST